MKPITFEEWAKDKGEFDSIGNMMLLTDEIEKRGGFGAIKKAAEILGHAFAKKLYEGYSLPNEVKVDKERDLSFRGTKWAFRVDVKKERLPDQYIHMALMGWQNEFAQRVHWENESLWGYMKHWIKRKLGKLQK